MCGSKLFRSLVRICSCHFDAVPDREYVGIAGLSRQAPNSALVEVMADIPEQRMLRLAREGSTLNRALVAAHALRRLHPIDTLDYQKVHCLEAWQKLICFGMCLLF
jgi:hypothetical protein